jgi:hypothetical protein
MGAHEGKWEVQIEGDKSDLDHLAQDFVVPPIVVTNYPGPPQYFRLQYAAFDICTSRRR